MIISDLFFIVHTIRISNAESGPSVAHEPLSNNESRVIFHLAFWISPQGPYAYNVSTLIVMPKGIYKCSFIWKLVI